MLRLAHPLSGLCITSIFCILLFEIELSENWYWHSSSNLTHPLNINFLRSYAFIFWTPSKAINFRWHLRLATGGNPRIFKFSEDFSIDHRILHCINWILITKPESKKIKVLQRMNTWDTFKETFECYFPFSKWQVLTIIVVFYYKTHWVCNW